MRLTAEEVEAAFVDAARDQPLGEPLDWRRVASLLNDRLADNLVGRAPRLAGKHQPEIVQ